MEHSIELFVLKAAAIRADLSRVSGEHKTHAEKSDVEVATDALIAPHMAQIDYQVRIASERMAEFYRLFYMLENHIRRFVEAVMNEAFEADPWWNKRVPEPVRKYAKDNKDRESKEGLPPRSQSPIDYLTFGQLGEIIKANWDVFAGLFPNCEIERLERVVSRLNLARGPIAHSGYLPEDEVVRLKLAIRDWFALSE
nr:Swt1 family HEPN domain-containing protein [uncultured Sphingomonas sp.]